nr:V-type proton ATPase subunit D2 [Ipomoea batatas]
MAFFHAVLYGFCSIGTELTREDRKKLYSNFGLLYPYGHEELAVCEDIDQIRAVMEKYPPYQSIFSKLSYGESQMLDKAFYEEEAKRLCLAFEQQFHYGIFFAYVRLREQEIRNLMWISECVAQNQKSRVLDMASLSVSCYPVMVMRNLLLCEDMIRVSWGSTSPVPAMVLEVIEDLKLLEKNIEDALEVLLEALTTRRLRMGRSITRKERHNSIVMTQL